MSAYVRTTTVDSAPSGDSVKQAILDLDTDLTGHVAAYNAHDTATTSVHGFTGTKTGSGAMVGATSPTLVTPVLGVATATSINKVALTAPATSATLTIADGKTLTCSNTLTLAGTDSTTITFPSTSCTVARTDAANSFTGTQTITDTATDTSANFLTITATIREQYDATHDHIGILSDVRTYTVDGLTTNSGMLSGFQTYAYIVSASHSGTLAKQAGVYSRSGIHTCGFGGTVTTTYAGYFGIINNSANGTITNAYGVYIDNSGVVGTITNRYGLSIAPSAGAGTLSYGIEIGALSGTQISKKGIAINAISGASTTNYGIQIGNVSGATNNYAIYTGTGDVRFGGMIDLASGQIKFPATESASADANTLDDYEEGTWTLELQIGGATTGITYNSSYTQGRYVKIGSMVMFTGGFLLKSKGSLTGDLTIAGLPFTNYDHNKNTAVVSLAVNNLTYSGSIYGRIEKNTAIIALYESPETGTRTALNNADIADNTSIFVSGCYCVV